MSNPRHKLDQASFFDLAQDIQKIIPTFVENEKVNNVLATLSISCKGLNALYRPHLDARLLQHVINSDYDQVEKAVKANPAFIFKAVKFPAFAKPMSPLQFSFYVYDTYMWQLYFKAIENNDRLKAQFFKQANEQQEHINLDPLFDEYEAYRKTCEKNPSCEVIPTFAIGKKQREYLPVHMIKRICQKNAKWHQSTFDVQKDPRPTSSDTPKVNNYDTTKHDIVLPYQPNIGLGYDFVISRGICDEAISGLTDSILFKDDLVSLRCLYQVRANDFKKLLASAPKAEQTAVTTHTRTTSSSLDVISLKR